MDLQVVDDHYLAQINEARKELYDLIVSKGCAPIMLRLAFNDAATYCEETDTGGPNGSIRMPAELEQSCNRGLRPAVTFCEDIKSRHPVISYADIYQLAGVVAVEASGGPSIEFIPGRKDSEECTEEGRLPDAGKGPIHLKNTFRRMGLFTDDLVILSGAHVLDRCQDDRSDFHAPLTSEPPTFDNSYFKGLLKEFKEELVKREPDYVQTEVEELLEGWPGGAIILPSDRQFVAFAEFRCDVLLYAEQPNSFLRRYAKSHKKLSELGFIKHKPFYLHLEKKKKESNHFEKKKKESNHFEKKKKESNVLPKTIAGVVIAASVMVLWYRMRWR